MPPRSTQRDRFAAALEEDGWTEEERAAHHAEQSKIMARTLDVENRCAGARATTRVHVTA